MIARWSARWGAPGAVAVVALLAALLLGAGLTPQWQAQAEAALRSRPPVPAPAPLPPAPSLQLPVTGEASDRVAALLRLAQRHGVEVERLQQQSDAAGPLPRLQLSLKAQGRYVELRAFVAAALQADPGLALDSLQWRRESAGSDELDAELHWSLWQMPSTAQRAS